VVVRISPASALGYDKQQDAESRESPKESVMSHDQIITVALAVVAPALLMNAIGIATAVSAGLRHALRFALVRAR